VITAHEGRRHTLPRYFERGYIVVNRISDGWLEYKRAKQCKGEIDVPFVVCPQLIGVSLLPCDTGRISNNSHQNGYNE